MNWPFERALVTGGAGFIGSHLVEHLLGCPCQVAVLDNLATGRLENLTGVRHDIDFFQGDICDEAALAAASKGCDVVFHLAAQVSVVQTVQAPVASARVNELGTLQVLEAARRAGMRRAVLSSSSAVYGNDARVPNQETMAPKPMSPYAVQKYTGELYAGLYNDLYGLASVCLRYFNVFGPRQDPGSPYSGVISIFMNRAIDGSRPVIFGDGGQSRDFVYVEDVVRANLLAATRPKAAGSVFNIGTGQAVCIDDLWGRICSVAGSDQAPRFEPARPGEIYASVAHIGRAAEQLGYAPEFAFDQGLALTYDWYRAGHGAAG